MISAETTQEEAREQRESQQLREQEAVEKLNEAEERKIEKDLAAGREPRSTDDDKEVDRASETWHRLAGIVSPPELPQDKSDS